MENINTRLKNLIAGDVDDSAETKRRFSHDASTFELVPSLVIAPKNSDDVKKIVTFVSENKEADSTLSLTVRSGGTDMSGGAINTSLILDFAKYFTHIGAISATEATAEPGVFYRDFEKATLEHGALMPSYPASREICTIGGMVANNAGGERSLQYGKTEKFVTALKVIFADGNEYEVRSLTKEEVERKITQEDYEGRLYKQVFELVRDHDAELQAAKPKVSKNSTGYNLWNVWNKETGVFDLTQLIVGSQGTLGIVTEITFRLVPAPLHSGTLVIFLRSIDDLGKLINTVMTHKPATFEGFDNYTLLLSFKLFFYFHRELGWWGMIKLGFQLIPEALKLMRGIPKMVLLVEFQAASAEEVATHIHALRGDLTGFDHEALFEEDETEAKARKFWIMRRESFNLLRKKVKNKYAVPFVDDLVVPPAVLPQFLPELRTIIKKYDLLATIAGHMGDGNFHIIPLMDIRMSSERAKLEPVMKEVTALVRTYGGSLSGEHNDGMIRGPWLEYMYGEKITSYFKRVKQIFDSKNIFNPHKKTDADWKFSMDHVRQSFDTKS